MLSVVGACRWVALAYPLAARGCPWRARAYLLAAPPCPLLALACLSVALTWPMGAPAWPSGPVLGSWGQLLAASHKQ